MDYKAYQSWYRKRARELASKSMEKERIDIDIALEDMKDKLAKAKELLERLLITSCNSDVLNLLPNCSEVLRVRVEAEQFLNSEVEK